MEYNIEKYVRMFINDIIFCNKDNISFYNTDVYTIHLNPNKIKLINYDGLSIHGSWNKNETELINKYILPEDIIYHFD